MSEYLGWPKLEENKGGYACAVDGEAGEPLAAIVIPQRGAGRLAF